MTIGVYSGMGPGSGTGFFDTLSFFFFEAFFFETLGVFGSGLTWSISSEVLLRGIVVGEVGFICYGQGLFRWSGVNRNYP